MVVYAARWIGGSLLPIVVAAVSSGSLSLAAIVLPIVVVVSVPFGMLAWRRFEYRVQDGRLELSQGVLSRSRRTLALDRIRGVEIVAGPLQRALGLVGVKVEAAAGGSEKAEISLPALGRAQALELRGRLLAGGPREAGAGAEVPGREGRELARVGLGTVALGGLTELGYALAPLAALAAVVSLVDDLPAGIPRRIERAALDRLPDDAAGALVAGLILVAAAALIGVIGSLLVDGGFRLREQGGRLVSERGLLTRRRGELDRARVRGVEIRDNPLRRALGLAALRAVVGGIAAGSGESRGRTTLLPVGRREVAWRLAQTLTPGISPALLPHPRAALGRRLARALGLPLIALAVALALREPAAIGLTAAAAAAMCLIGVERYRALGHGVADGRVALRSGSLSRRHTIVDRETVVAYRIRSSPGQRRRGLCTLVAALPEPAGARLAIDLSEDQARSVLLAAEPGLVSALQARAG